MSEKFEDLLAERAPQSDQPDAEDLVLWQAFTKEVSRLKKSTDKILVSPSIPCSDPETPTSIQSHTDHLPFEVTSTFSQESNTVGQDSRQQRRRRRRAVPEATLDLHGMTQKKAFQELYLFIERAHFHGFKTVRIITGKGGIRSLEKGTISRQTGVLRQALPLWVRTPPLSSFVTGFTQARSNDGGAGAWYLFL